MLYIVSNHPQGSPEWRADRAGKATGSKANCITAEGRTKGVEATTRRDYRIQLVAERLSGMAGEEGFVSKEMSWGTEQEPFARMAFESLTGEIVEEAGFLYRPDIAAGCSLDGFVGLDRRGIFEAKCPKTATHVAYLLAGRVPPEYVPQVTHNLWVTGCEFVDFCSFDPRLPGLELFHVRAERNEFDIKGYEAKLLQFISEVDALEIQLRALRQPLAIAA